MTELAEPMAAIDAERQAQGVPADPGDVVRELAADGSWCRIVFSRVDADAADTVIATEKALADVGGYRLEWKLYGHDAAADLGARLLAAGFVA